MLLKIIARGIKNMIIKIISITNFQIPNPLINTCNKNRIELVLNIKPSPLLAK
jgi:hypothetical protein